MSNAKRLHPISAVTNFFKQLKELIFPFVALLVFGTRVSERELGFLFSSVLIIILVLVMGIVSWLRFSYRLEEGELRIEYGVFVRKKRYIPFERIQSLDLSEGLLHRPFGLVKVKVETAGSSGSADAEAVLTAITKEEANQIQGIIAQSKNKQTEVENIEQAVFTPEIQESILYKISPKELFLLASTSGGVGVVISAVFAFLTQFDELIPFEKVFKEMAQFISNGVVIITLFVFIGFLIAWLLALVGTMVKYADFTVKITGKDIVISRGLLEKRQITIPLNRIQAIRMSENILRQPLGLCSVYIISAGGSVSNSESSKVLLLPAVKKERVVGLIQDHLPIAVSESPFNPLPYRALTRYVFRGCLFALPFVITLIVVFKLWGTLSLLLFLLFGGWSYLMYKDAGWKIEDQQLSVRYRALVKHTLYMKKHKMQSLDYKESIFQRRRELASITSIIKSGMGAVGGTVVDLEKEDAKAIYEWYSSKRKAPL